MHKLFQTYVSDLLTLVQENDGVFDKHEMVILLHSVSGGREYLERFLEEINLTVLEEEDRRHSAVMDGMFTRLLPKYILVS